MRVYARLYINAFTHITLPHRRIQNAFIIRWQRNLVILSAETCAPNKLVRCTLLCAKRGKMSDECRWIHNNGIYSTIYRITVVNHQSAVSINSPTIKLHFGYGVNVHNAFSVTMNGIFVLPTMCCAQFKQQRSECKQYSALLNISMLCWTALKYPSIVLCLISVLMIICLKYIIAFQGLS